MYELTQENTGNLDTIIKKKIHSFDFIVQIVGIVNPWNPNGNY